MGQAQATTSQSDNEVTTAYIEEVKGLTDTEELKRRRNLTLFDLGDSATFEEIESQTNIRFAVEARMNELGISFIVGEMHEDVLDS